MNEKNLAKYKEIETKTKEIVHKEKLTGFKEVFEKQDSKEGKRLFIEWQKVGKQKLMT